MSYAPYRMLSSTNSRSVFIFLAAFAFAILFFAAQQVELLISSALTVAVDDEIMTMEDMAITIEILANDAPLAELDLDSLRILLSPSYGTYSVQAGEMPAIVYQPFANFWGEDLFEYQICNIDGSNCGQAIVNVKVKPVNDEILAVDDSVTVSSGLPVEIDILANDIDDDLDIDLTTLVIMDSAERGTIEVVHDRINYITNQSGGVDQFRYQICEKISEYAETVACSVATVQILIGEVENVREQVIANGMLTVAPGGVNRNSSPSIRFITDPNNGTAVVEQDGTVSYQPATGFAGTDAFMMEFCREPADCETIQYSVTVGFIEIHLPFLSL